ncbi:hypothetical protein C8R43DRAFT_1242874, partial [Mycena crocata]
MKNGLGKLDKDLESHGWMNVDYRDVSTETCEAIHGLIHKPTKYSRSEFSTSLATGLHIRFQDQNFAVFHSNLALVPFRDGSGIGVLSLFLPGPAQQKYIDPSMQQNWGCHPTPVQQRSNLEQLFDELEGVGPNFSVAPPVPVPVEWSYPNEQTPSRLEGKAEAEAKAKAKATYEELRKVEAVPKIPDWFQLINEHPKFVGLGVRKSVYYHPQVERLPVSSWTSREIPKGSALYRNWTAGDWVNWKGLDKFRPRWQYINRSSFGIRIREGFRIDGLLMPLAHFSCEGGDTMIFTTTVDLTQFYCVEDARTVYYLGKFHTLDEFWHKVKPRNKVEMILDDPSEMRRRDALERNTMLC